MSPLRILVTGAHGQVGSRVVNEARSRQSGIEVIGASSSELDITNRTLVHEWIRSQRPDWVVNCAAATGVDACEVETYAAYSVNAIGVRWLVEASEAVGAHVCHLSSDYVFDGRKDLPYVEWDTTNPLSVYGASKLAGETELRHGQDLLIRSSWVMSESPGNIASVIRTLVAGTGELRFVDDQVGSPTNANDLAKAVVDLVERAVSGTVHVANAGVTSWWGLASRLAILLGGDPNRVVAIDSEESRRRYRAPRPRFSALESWVLPATGVAPLRSWEEALDAIVTAWEESL
ncbi:MAG: dTDP-4-dehydrorhamnose reductase [Ferrimicrobium sp.]